MRLFVKECNNCNNRIYLTISALNRNQLAERIGFSFEVQCPHCRNYTYHTVNEVFAEPGPHATPAGAILGGLIGLIGGPLGVFIGGAMGGAIGLNADDQERRIVHQFNLEMV